MTLPAEHFPVSVTRGNPAAPFLFVCEHASSHIPPEYENLGLQEAALTSHIAWDPGALLVTNRLRESFDACAVTGKISRLIYDCNRPPESPSAIPIESERCSIPGNQNLTDDQRIARIEACYRPFENVLENEISRLPATIGLVTIHSFTPVYNGRQRDVELGILHDDDSRFADAMLAVAAQHSSFNVQRNQPYGPEHGVTHTLKRHGIKNGLLNVMLEIRNDHLQTPDACYSVADMLENWLADALDNYSSQSDAMEVRA
ncbi:MAG: N-formylglutamate amidohydrolase [Hyphomicrobiales bacterium]|nr:MAG: N-formylglutamate amidohydrolase [Hyphomicrobiales bacterium]